MMEVVVAGMLAGYGIAVPVGPVATYLVGLSARSSARVGAFAALGIASADGIYALIAAIAGAALAPVLVPIVMPLRWISMLVLVALALTGAITAVRRYRARRLGGVTREAPLRARTAYFGMLGMTLLSPMTVIYFAALVLGSTGTGSAPLFVVAAFLASSSWQLLLAGGGVLLGRVLTGHVGGLVTALASSVLIVVLAVRLVA
ncbi:lysine transporter LysE [Kribbella antibiotica]|uniref:Lysine transporter LysE n=1 Tax=Kribbella antibiotica TaxID=190195 RepID=A0A4R4ZNN6_9ACTN|nr:lysine transporter LysE [Kribbella antibiotica]TDD59574.1 lysine transporter LysE [Kribbella antibiotica]